jgi:hypothetical protein
MFCVQYRNSLRSGYLCNIYCTREGQKVNSVLVYLKNDVCVTEKYGDVNIVNLPSFALGCFCHCL